MGGHAHTRLRSPNAWSMRTTGGKYLSARGTPAGFAPCVRGYGRAQSSTGGPWAGGGGGPAERTLVDRPLPPLDRGDLVADRDHRVTEPIDLRLRLRLRRLDH